MAGRPPFTGRCVADRASLPAAGRVGLETALPALRLGLDPPEPTRTVTGTLGSEGGAKPEYTVFSPGKDSRLTSRTGNSVEDPYQRIGIAFWVQRKSYWNPKKIGRVLQGLDPVPGLEELRALEGGLRCLVYRMRKLKNWDERHR